MRATTFHKKTVSKDAFNISLTNVQSQWTIPNFLVNGIHCSVLRHLKNMFYMSNERSWLQPLFTKWSCQIMFSIIRNNIWERIRCQTLHIVLRLSDVESSLEYFEGVIKWIADPSPQSLLCHRPMEPIFYLFAGIGKIRY